jgi:hypothetical protein
MGVAGLMFAVFGLGYMIGVWTALLVLRQPRTLIEDDVRSVQSVSE